MMTSARPMAMSRSRVQTRISLRSVFAEDGGPPAEPAGTFAEPEGEDRRESGFSGEVEEPRCFWSERSILGTVLFIAWASRRAPVAISYFAQKATGHARPSTRKIPAHPRAFYAAITSGVAKIPIALAAPEVQDSWPERA